MTLSTDCRILNTFITATRFKFPRVIVLVSLLSAIGFAARGHADDAFRVVVQDARPSVIAVYAEPHGHNLRRIDRAEIGLVAAVESNSRSEHVFYVIDPIRKSLIHAIKFPERVIAASFAKSKDWFLVSGENRLYRVDAKSGAYEILLDKTAGQVAIAEDEKNIVVLGSFDSDNLDRRDAAHNFNLRGPFKLGVFDLVKKEWTVQTSTPIQIPEQVYYDGETVIGIGLGGRVHHRAASSFPCHVVLNLKSKKANLARGSETRFGRPAADDDYVLPTKALLNRTRLQLCRQLIPDAVKNLDPAPRSGLTNSFTPMTANDGSAMIFVNRYTEKRWLPAVFKITQSGKIEVRKRSGVGQPIVRLNNDIYLQEYSDRTHSTFTNLITGKQTEHPRPDPSSNRAKVIRKLTRCGCLSYSKGKFQMLELGGDIRWSRDGFAAYTRLDQFAVSRTGKLLAFTQNDQPIQILDSRNGTTVLKIDRPKNTGESDFRYTRSICFNDSDTRVAVLYDREIRVYDLESGKQLRQILCEKKAYIQKVFFVNEQWFLSGFVHSQFWDPEKGLGQELDFNDVTSIQSYSQGAQKYLLLQNQRGKVAIYDSKSLALLSRKLIGYKGPSQYDADPIPNVAPLLDDQVLVVPTGLAAQFELLSTQDSSTIATVHPIPVDGELGWILYTEDGRWDASKGAEKYVLVFKDGEQQADYIRDQRRRNGLLSELLSRR